MARRKRRTTKPSHSQRSAARRRLTLGDTVRVKDAVMEPDYEGYSMGGWRGEIVAFETWEQTPMALIEWDATTRRDHMAPQVRQRAASQGLAAAQRWLHLSDLERVEVLTGGQRAEGQPRGQGGEAAAASWTPPSCGHTEPDVLRLRAAGRAERTCVRPPDCRYCGRAASPFPASILAEELRLALEAMGSGPGMAEDESERVRQREERRLRKRRRAGRWWQRWWWRECVRPR